MVSKEKAESMENISDKKYLEGILKGKNLRNGNNGRGKNSRIIEVGEDKKRININSYEGRIKAYAAASGENVDYGKIADSILESKYLATKVARKDKILYDAMDMGGDDNFWNNYFTGDDVYVVGAVENGVHGPVSSGLENAVSDVPSGNEVSGNYRKLSREDPEVILRNVEKKKKKGWFYTAVATVTTASLLIAGAYNLKNCDGVGPDNSIRGGDKKVTSVITPKSTESLSPRVFIAPAVPVPTKKPQFSKDLSREVSIAPVPTKKPQFSKDLSRKVPAVNYVNEPEKVIEDRGLNWTEGIPTVAERGKEDVFDKDGRLSLGSLVNNSDKFRVYLFDEEGEGNAILYAHPLNTPDGGSSFREYVSPNDAVRLASGEDIAKAVKGLDLGKSFLEPQKGEFGVAVKGHEDLNLAYAVRLDGNVGDSRKAWDMLSLAPEREVNERDKKNDRKIGRNTVSIDDRLERGFGWRILPENLSSSEGSGKEASKEGPNGGSDGSGR